jgi:hypothetical protein
MGSTLPVPSPQSHRLHAIQRPSGPSCVLQGHPNRSPTRGAGRSLPYTRAFGPTHAHTWDVPRRSTDERLPPSKLDNKRSFTLPAPAATVTIRPSPPVTDGSSHDVSAQQGERYVPIGTPPARIVTAGQAHMAGCYDPSATPFALPARAAVTFRWQRRTPSPSPTDRNALPRAALGGGGSGGRPLMGPHEPSMGGYGGATKPVSTRRHGSLGALGGARVPAGVEEGGRLVGCRAG